MDHVERLLEVLELRAIVCVVSSPEDWKARVPGVVVTAKLSVSSLGCGVDFSEGPGICREKAKKS
jgi:hypothetical protein